MSVCVCMYMCMSTCVCVCVRVCMCCGGEGGRGELYDLNNPRNKDLIVSCTNVCACACVCHDR